MLHLTYLPELELVVGSRIRRGEEWHGLLLLDEGADGVVDRKYVFRKGMWEILGMVGDVPDAVRAARQKAGGERLETFYGWLDSEAEPVAVAAADREMYVASVRALSTQFYCPSPDGVPVSSR